MELQGLASRDSPWLPGLDGIPTQAEPGCDPTLPDTPRSPAGRESMPGCVVSATSGLEGPLNLSGSLRLGLGGSPVSNTFFSDLRHINWLW